MDEKFQSIGESYYFQSKYSVKLDRLRNENKEMFFESLKGLKKIIFFLKKNRIYTELEDTLQRFDSRIKGLKIVYYERIRPYKIFDYGKRLLENGYQLSLRNRNKDFFLSLTGIPKVNFAEEKYVSTPRLGISLHNNFSRFFSCSTKFDTIIHVIENMVNDSVFCDDLDKERIEILNLIKNNLSNVGIDENTFGFVKVVMEYLIHRHEFQFLVDSYDDSIDGKELFYWAFDKVIISDAVDAQSSVGDYYQLEMRTKLSEFINSQNNNDIIVENNEDEEINNLYKLSILSYIIRVFRDSGIGADIYGKNYEINNGILLDILKHHIFEERRNLYEILSLSNYK